MKTPTIVRNGISPELVGLVSRLVDLVPWPERRRAMGDATLVLLDGKHRVAEDVFGWGRSVVKVGINELKTGISCVNDLSKRIKPKTEEKNPELLLDIHKIMEPHSEADSHLRTTLLHTNMTAKTVYDSLVEKGWSAESLPTVRTISNILLRQNYQLRTVAKTKVQKKQLKPTSSLKTSGR
jgi:hypothetical protein